MSDSITLLLREVFEGLPPDHPGLTLDEIYSNLLVQLGRVDMAQLKRVISEFMEDGIIAASSITSISRVGEDRLKLKGRLDPSTPYQMNIFEEIKMQPRDKIERASREEQDLWINEERYREQRSQSVLLDIAAGHAQESAFAEEIRRAALLFANEDPVELILEMAQWVIADLNGLAKQFAQAQVSNVEDAKHIEREMGFRRMKAVRFFQRLWRLDASFGGDSGIMHIPTVSHLAQQAVAFIRLERAREQLRQRVVGKRVIEIVSMPKNSHRAAIGTDASVGDVMVKHREGSFIPPTPAVLFVASAALYSKDSDTLGPYWDFDIDPRKLERYDDIEAAEEGLLISPKLQREAITDFRHLRSAAMELRQYKEELRVLEKSADWRPIAGLSALRHPPEPSLLIRDGRIFPLVHRIDDYDGASAPDDILYGTIVRREIDAFHRVFLNSAGMNRLGSIYGGAVKSPEFSWLAMMVFWYLSARCGKKEMSDGFYRPILNDQAVTHLLFWGLAENDQGLIADSRAVFLTFRVIRRYSDIAFDSHPLLIQDQSGQSLRVIDEDSENDWIEYIQQHISDANERHYKLRKRGVPSLERIEAYRPFLDLCRRSGVAMFYAVPARMYLPVIESHAHFLSPRWEIAVDVTTLTHQNLDEKVQKMFSWLVDEGGLVRDNTHTLNDFEEPEQGLPLLVPDVVQQAHETVVFARSRHIPEIEERLRTLIAEIQKRGMRIT